MKILCVGLAASVMVLGLTGCASTSFTQLARNQAVVSTSAAPVCHESGAAAVANQGAAIATIKQGFERFIIVGYGTEDNTRVISTGPTYSTTSGTFDRFGSTIHGSSRTQFGGQSTFVTGRNNAELRIVMLNANDVGYEEGIDAKQVLGPEWRAKVEDGVANCF